MAELFSAFGIDWRLLLVQAVNFGLLLLVLHRFLYKPVLKVIAERQKKIEEGIRDAEAGKAFLASAETERVNTLTTATQEANAIIDSARAKAKTEERTILKDAHDRSETLLSEAKRIGESEKELMIRESREEVARMAVLAAEKILREKVS